jgi:ABC-type transport system involved in multi-copper enzyme maturation permease subunit
MFAEVFRFECRYQLRGPLFPIVALMFFLLAFLGMASENVTIGGGTGNLNLNAAFTIVQTHFVFAIIAMFASIAFVATAITRDYELKSAELLFSTGVPRHAYLFGRFAGGSLFAFLASSAAVLGTLSATFMPWLDPERIGEFAWAPYAFSIWGVMLPSVFIVCALFFSVAALARSLFAAYVAAVGLIIALVVVAANTDQETIRYTALADPFGQVAFAEVTRYWTVFDKNLRVPELAGTLLYSRVIWVGLALFSLLVTAARFRFSLSPGWRPRLRRRARPAKPAPISKATATVRPSFGGSLALRQLASQVRMDVRGVLKSVPFYVILLFGIVNVLSGFYFSIGQLYGTPVLPVTGLMIQAVAGSYLFIAIIIIIYYAGELVHREQQSGMASIVDATPVPNAVLVVGKIVALWFVIVTLLAVVMITAMVIQAVNGYYDFQPGVYLVGLFLMLGWPMYLLGVVAVLIQVLVRSKFAGMAVVLVVFLGLPVLDSLGFEHGLYQIGLQTPRYSDLNGWGHFVTPALAFGTYWSLIAVLMGVVAHLFFRRGHVDRLGERFAIARQRLTRPVMWVSALSLAATVSLGGWIFYNTNVLNRYETQEDLEQLQADYEQRYKQYEALAQPEPVELDVAVDIFPEQRRIETRGRMLLENVRDEPLDELHLSIASSLKVNSLTVQNAELLEADRELGYHRYRLLRALQPGERVELEFDLSWLNPGFVNKRSSTRVVGNGTFVNNLEIMPAPGYNSGIQLVDNNKRRKYGLDPAERLPSYDDAQAAVRSQFGVATRTAFRAIVSTSADQIAVAPGYLQREWREGDRRYFEYEMDEPIWPFVSFLSARYEVAKGQWNDVAIEVYHHPAHDHNVERMIEATQKSLDYFTAEFSPYQYRQFRILEFPAYARFAQSFPNTIPFSEAIGFVADLRDDKDIDYVFYVTAHEMAHQWWAHQVVGRTAQGMTVLVETLAQYSALMVLEREYGPQRMRRFLKYELDRYLSDRGGELIEELPLKLVENQGYIHYRKGSLVMYALKDALGEAAVNRALRKIIDQYAFKGAPFPRSGALIDALRAEAGPEHQALITDLFEKITLFDLRVAEVEVEETSEGRYRVEVAVSARKFEADGSGRETESPMDLILDIAVFGEAGDVLGDDDLPEPLLLEKQRIRTGETRFEFILDERPVRVGIDPYLKMIDKNPDDNLKRV